MSIGKQAKILNDKQQNLTMAHLETTRYPLRNKIIFLLSFKEGLRAKEISKLAWCMVCNSDGKIADVINLSNNASKGKYSGRIIPLHKELKILLADLLAEKQKDEYFSLDKPVIATERGEHTTPQVIVNFFYHLYKTIGFNGCSSHSGRRTFITNAAKHISLVGGTLNDVRMLAGHSSLATTQRYIAYDTEAQRKIVEMS
ncbi:MAG: site-specific integrase [Alphaproteobacteria bacterium]|nr:site-specific integrase [Alphaproteobacteria bacterium]